MNSILRIFLGVAIGAVLGGLLGYYGKCTSNTCPLTRNPYITAIYGAVIGLLFALMK
jgi:hypothetical protein